MGIDDDGARREEEGLVERATRFMEAEVANYDASHDSFHAKRVEALTASLLDIHGGFSRDEETVARLAALLHDVQDYKYAGVRKRARAGSGGVDGALDGEEEGEEEEDAVARFLVGEEFAHVEEVLFVIRKMGFKESLPDNGPAAAAAAAGSHEPGVGAGVDRLKVLRVVQDADRLVRPHRRALPARAAPARSIATAAA